MRIANNVPALTAFNSLNSTNTGLQKTIKALSTGLRINSASDDAAGFAISEKMRSQISGLDVALRNSQDGISFLQTAEGALEQTNSMLQRMRELAVQASNDTLTSNDRQYLQLEIDELKNQIDKISGTTQFNNKRLLDGSSGAMWSSSDINVKAVINGGLTYIDDFGQKVSAEGNYKIEVKASGGQAQVQKSNIINTYYEENITKTRIETPEHIIGYEDKEFDPYEILINEGVDSAGNTSGPGWSFSNGVFTISKSGNYNIVGDGTISPHRFVVNAGVDAKIVLDNVNIQTRGYSPFEMSGATVDMYLKGTNTLVCSGNAHGAGLQTSETSNLTINCFDKNDNSAGTLIATGNAHGAGIGGACSSGNPAPSGNIGKRNDAGTITIKGGTIIATGGTAAAGIGGGSSGGQTPGSYTSITIEGGNVTANGGAGGAGIGTASDYYKNSTQTPKTDAGQIFINGGTVTANGGSADSYYPAGAGIGGGGNFNSGKIEISSNATVTANGWTDENQAKSIGYGQYGTASNVISTNTQPSAPNDPPVFPPVTVPVPIIEPEKIEESTETAESHDTNLRKISHFYKDGVFLLSRPQTLTITQGDGKSASITLYEHDTIEDVAEKINNAISDSLGQAQYTNNKDKFCTLSDGTENTSESVYSNNFVKEEETVETFNVVSDSVTKTVTITKNIKQYSISRTMLIRSVIPGKEGEISFSGDEDLLNALGLNTIQESEEASYSVSIKNAHTGKVIDANLKMSGNIIRGVIDPDIDIEIKFDSMAGLNAVWNENTKSYVISHDELYSAMLHLKDNSTAFQIGANQGEDFLIQLGDSSCNALGISAVNVLTRETASRSIGVIDSAINKISSQRAKIGAYENALEHTMQNLTTTSLNLTNAESRIRDADMSKTMMEFVKLQILNQSGTSMLAQANQLPNSVLSLLQ